MNILGKKLLLITAHPDDESFLAAGTIYLNHCSQGQTSLICATLGEKGKYHLNTKMSESKLKQTRKQELLKVSKLIKVHKLLLMDLPDGELNKKEYKKFFYEYSLNLAKSLQPDLILSFGPDGITGHIDHLATAEVAKRVAKKLKIKLLKFALPPKIIPNAKKWFKVRRKNNHYTDNVHYIKPDVKIPIDKKIKWRSLLAHRSQLFNNNPFYHFPKSAAEEMLSNEWFVSKD